MGQKILSEEIRHMEVCKFHNFCNHVTNNSIILRNTIQDCIDKGEFKFPKKEKATIRVDRDPFLKEFGTNMASISMTRIP